jgi:hypothetical protein
MNAHKCTQADAALDRLVRAKAEWSRVAVMALKGEPSAADRVAPALAELTAARQALDAMTNLSFQDAGAGDSPYP